MKVSIWNLWQRETQDAKLRRVCLETGKLTWHQTWRIFNEGSARRKVDCSVSWHLWSRLSEDCVAWIGSFAFGWSRITFVVVVVDVDVVSQICSFVANTWSNRSLCPSRHVCASLTWLCQYNGNEKPMTFDELSRLWRTARASLERTCNCSLSLLRRTRIS